MSRQFGQVAQLGYVVRDLDHALQYWTQQLEIGPFFVVRDLRLPEICYRGRKQPLTLSVAYGHSGGAQIELIEPSAEPSIYLEFAELRGVGVHHVGYMVDDFPAAIAAAERRSFTPIQSGAFGGTSFAYFDTGQAESGPVIEIMETSAAKWQRFNAIKAAATAWDGSDPVRETPIASLASAGYPPQPAIRARI
jgi:catechol 2,3-dioxygenase-like lactoylglutathione lyase family enzyme